MTPIRSLDEPRASARQARAVLWDLDGTLVDSADYHWRSWRDTLAAEGVTITHDQFLQSFGQRNDRILTAWLGPESSATGAERMRRIGNAKEALYRTMIVRDGLAALPGAAEWVERLHVSGWRQAIATSAPRENAETMLRVLGLTDDFEAIAAAEDVTRGKPDPQVFLEAARRLGVAPSRSIVVEDAAAVIAAAKAGGMRCIAVNPHAPLGADVDVTSLADLNADAFDRLVSD